MVPVRIVTPFPCEFGVRRRQPEPRTKPAQHAIHRARAWRRRLDNEPGLKRLQLAKEENLSPASITQHLKLLLLVEEIQAHLLNLTTELEVRRFSLKQLLPLADLPWDEQRRRFVLLKAG